MTAARVTRLPFVLSIVAVFFWLGSCPATAAPNVKNVDFERHIMGLFGRMGCNAAACHGSFQGKGGFRLSLFGYAPEKDYLALTRDVLARRINPVDPDQSLLLLKATGQIDHGGGRRFSRDSWQYQLFRDWIEQGAPWRPGSGQVTGLVIAPPECAFPKAGDKVRLRVRVRFADGTNEDITALCEFRVNDDAVATVTPEGEVRGLRAGDTAVVVSYRGQVQPLRVLVSREVSPGFRYPDLPETNYVDRDVFAKLRRLKIVPSGPADDAEFLRRVTIDTVGCLPAPDEVRAFLADKSPDKRARKIEELLSHPLHAALWATKFCDITGNNSDQLEPPQDRRSQMWHDWFRQRIARNTPYDEIVRGVLCATSRDGRSPEDWLRQVKATDEAAQKGGTGSYADRATLDLFWRRRVGVTIDQWGEKTAAAFLGIRLECAQCHKHPFDRWTQRDYRSYANLFGQVVYAVSPESKSLIDAENAERRKAVGGKGKKPQLPPVREVFVSVRTKVNSLPDPDTKRPLAARALGGPEIPIESGKDARVALFEWMHAPDNPYFARSFVNRVWGHYFGVGLVDPVDNFALGNPPSNEELLDALARDFVAHRFDIRYIERTILNSRVYQLGSTPNETNRLDRHNYSHSFVRPLMAEVVVDVIDAALGVDTTAGGKGSPYPRGTHAIEIGATRIPNGNLSYAFRVFGRPPRTSACDCERGTDPALSQVLYRMTDPAVLTKLQASRVSGRLHEVLASKKTDDEVLEELFLATLGRYPTQAERKQFEVYRAAKMRSEKVAATGKSKSDRTRAQNRRDALFEDTLWALINTREFILNH